MNDVIESCKYHQHQDDRETDAEAHFLGLFRERPSADALDDIEQKVTAIEQRDREEVQKPDRYRQNGRQLDERNKTETRHLSRHLGDPDRTAQLVRGFAAGDYAADVGERPINDRPGLLRREPNGLRGCNRVKLQVLRSGRRK